MSIDAKKAFNHLEWSFLFKTLEAFNFPVEMLHFIKILYKYLKAKIDTNNTLSDEIDLKKVGHETGMSSLPSPVCSGN